MSKAGRRSRGGTPAPSTAVTGTVEELIFLMLMGGGTLSQGMQLVIRRIIKDDEEADGMMRQAIWMRDKVAELLQKEGSKEQVAQRDIYRYITSHYWELVEEYRAG